MRTPLLLALSMTVALAACGGGSSSLPSTPSGGSGSSSQPRTESAISTMNALGTPVKTANDYDDSSNVAPASESRRFAQSYTLGSCENGIEFFAPDKSGDPNSTQTEYFYDNACTQLARNVVRIYSIGGSSETVDRTESQYALGNAKPIAQRSTTQSIINATFGQYGAPVVSDGFDESDVSSLNVSGAKTIVSDDELVVAAGSGVNDFCGDSAGYNATGIAALDVTFGWQGGVSSGTRTVNGDGSVTWQGTHAGSTFVGAIGSLSIDANGANTACPISTPEYTLAGGTQRGSYSIPATITFANGVLTDLTISNASLPNGNTLDVTTNASLQPTNADFITGTISNGSNEVASFNLDTFGDGTLTIAASGSQYVIDDWHVIR